MSPSVGCCRRRAAGGGRGRAYRQALAIRRKLADDNRAIVGYRHDYAISLLDLGWLLFKSGEWDAAAVERRKALPILRALAEEHPSVLDFRLQLAKAYSDLAVLSSTTGRARTRKPVTAPASNTPDTRRREPEAPRVPPRDDEEPHRPGRGPAQRRKAVRGRRRPRGVAPRSSRA